MNPYTDALSAAVTRIEQLAAENRALREAARRHRQWRLLDVVVYGTGITLIAASVVFAGYVLLAVR
jgi:hypothetical protein